MKFFKKILSKKLKDLTVKEILRLKDESGVYYKDVTDECEFKPFCRGGNGDYTYGPMTGYYAIGVYHDGDLIFKLDHSCFKDKSVLPVDCYNDDREYLFRWLVNGTFMVVRREQNIGGKE